MLRFNYSIHHSARRCGVDLNSSPEANTHFFSGLFGPLITAHTFSISFFFKEVVC